MDLEPRSKETFGLHSSHLRNFQQFSPSFSLSPVLSYTLHAKPLLSVPPEVKNDPILRSVIDSNPHLFKIVTPINVDIFECYVSLHSNQPFTLSVCEDLHYGFWSQASVCPDYPPTLDVSDQHPHQSTAEELFIYQQHDQEVALGCFSPAFGPDLLPDMYSMPVHAVLKVEQDFHLVTNHSCSEFC
ncbi:hypothetical protein BDQ17DRAFT_1249127 [Cyathus striatus]|nr:hypothetical protein BDQ17DRAFT_1249127 [Cyathus striatus]